LRPERKSGIRQRLSSLVGYTLALAAFAAFAGVALAQQTTLTSTVPQSGFAGGSSTSSPLTGAQPFTFGAQEVQACQSIESISVTLTLFDGDTAPGDFDENQFTLGLDGIDTGILLNGFPNEQTVTLTIPGTPNNAADILAALQADNQLAGTIIDASPADNFIEIPANFDTTLEITCATAPPDQQKPDQQKPDQQQPDQQQPDQQQPDQQQPGGGPITQEVEQEAESGDIDQSFTVAGGGDNGSQCANVTGDGNTGNLQNTTGSLQFASDIEEIEQEDIGSDLSVSGTSTVTCEQQVNQAAAAG
jgi:hypothetical protein